jgi:molecular chaperone DnaK
MKKVIGIDLGTTNSVMSIKKKDVEIIRNRENEELTKSCVAIKNDEVMVGRTAFNNLKRNPENTVLSVKRLMGGAFKDDMVQKMISETKKTRGYYKYDINKLLTLTLFRTYKTELFEIKTVKKKPVIY